MIIFCSVLCSAVMLFVVEISVENVGSLSSPKSEEIAQGQIVKIIWCKSNGNNSACLISNLVCLNTSEYFVQSCHFLKEFTLSLFEIVIGLTLICIKQSCSFVPRTKILRKMFINNIKLKQSTGMGWNPHRIYYIKFA